MIRLLNFLEQNGPMLLAGASIILSLGALLCFLHKSPAKRQRISEFTTLFTLSWLLLACIPLNRIPIPSGAGVLTGVNIPAPKLPQPPSLTTPTGLLSAANTPNGAGVLTGVSNPAPKLLQPPSLTTPTGLLSAADVPSGAGVLTGVNIPAPITLQPPSPTTPIISPLPSPHQNSSWPPPFPLALLIGSALMTLRILLGQLLLFRIFSHSKPAPNLADLASREGAPNVDLRVSTRLSRPISFGLFRPKIILPSAYLNQPSRVRQVLLHEIAHIKRKDAWGNLLMSLASLIFWFHPLFWLLNAQARLARELLADDWAANKGDKQSYAMELIAIARLRVGSGSVSGIALGIVGSRSEFFRRMHMLISRKHNLEMTCPKLWRAGMLTLGLCLAATLAATLGVKPAIAAATQPPVESPATAPAKGEGIFPNDPMLSGQNPVVITAATDDGEPANVIIKSGNKRMVAGTVTLNNGNKTYTVKPGDTIKSISKTLYSDEKEANEFLAINASLNELALKPGAIITVTNKYAISSIATLAEPESPEIKKLIESYQKLGLTFLEDELKLMAEKHIVMQQTAAEAQLAFERGLDRMKAGQEDPKIADMLENNPTLQKLNDQLFQLKQEHELNRQTLGPDNAKFKAVQDQLERLMRDYETQHVVITRRIKAQLEQSLKEQAESAKQNLEAMEQRIQAMQKAKAELMRRRNAPQNNVLVTPNPFQTDPKTLLRGVTLTGTILGTGDDQGKATAVFQIDGVGIRECHVGDSFLTQLGSVFTVDQIQSNQATLRYNNTLYDLTMASIVTKEPTPANAAPPKIEKPVGIAAAKPQKTADLSMDLASLANTAMEAKGAVNLAKVKLSQATTQDEKKLAEVNLDNANQRVALLKNMIKISLDSAQQEAQRTKDMYNAGLRPTDEYEASMSRLNLLKSIYSAME